MILFPAIDLKDGKCVRLFQGDMDKATVFNNDPASQACRFRDQGFEWIHVVDLNGAFKGRSINGPAIESILSVVDIPVQLGGGIRSLGDVENWLTRGVERVVLGTLAVHKPELVRQACREFPGHIAVSIDARAGNVAVNGWAQTSEFSAVDIARKFEDAGSSAIVYTDIERDGALTGLNVEETAALAIQIETPVIASGGVTSLFDLHALKARALSGISGVISGRAIYEGRIDPAEALALLSE